MQYFWIRFKKVVSLAGCNSLGEISFGIYLGIGLCNNKAFFFVGSDIFDFIGNFAVLYDSVRSFDKSELIDSGKDTQGIDQANVRSFRSLNWTDTAVVGWVNIAHLKSRSFPIQSSGPKSTQSTLVCDLGQWIDLVHELGQLAARKEIANNGAQCFGINQFLRSDRIHALIV